MKSKLTRVVLVALTANACGSNQTNEPEPQGSGAEPMATGAVSTDPSAPPASPSLVLGMGETDATNSIAVYAYSDATDTSPTTFEITAAGVQTTYLCQVLMPGNTSMTNASISASMRPSCEATDASEDLLVSVEYPLEELPPRDSNSPLQPPELPAPPPTNCVGNSCSTTASNYDPSPQFPHVRVFVSASVASEVTIAAYGNGRDFEIPVSLLSPSDPAWGRTGIYLNVDQPPR